jgi:stringent starvation protein B
MDNSKNQQGGKCDGGQHHVHIPALVKVPEVTARDDGWGILPAEADQRDKAREETEPPDEAGQEKLADVEQGKEGKDIYDRFSPAKKRMILAIVSYSAFISRMLLSTPLASSEYSADIQL